MPSRYSAEVRRQVVALARSGTSVAQLAETFGMSEATVYNWTKQEKIDRGEVEGWSTEQALELAAKRCLSEISWRAKRSLTQASEFIIYDPHHTANSCRHAVAIDTHV